MTKFKKKKKKKKKRQKNNLRIISKLNAHLQTMAKAHVKVQDDRHKTVGGVARRRYLLLGGWGGGGGEPRNHRKPNTLSPRFPSKRQGTTNQLCYDRYPDIRQTSCTKVTGTKGQHTEPKASFQPCKRVVG